MVAVVTGAGLGLQNGSLAALGAPGQLGAAAFGRGGERVYVNAGNGNLILQHQDEFLAGGLPLGLIRTYNSQGQGGDAGNWRLGYSRQVTGLQGALNTAGSSVHRIAEDGSDTLYAYDAGRGLYVSQRSDGGADDTLRGDAQGWTWTDGASQAQERYDAGGRLQQTRDRDGQTVDVGYDGAGRIVSLKRSGGEALFVDYDAQGQLSQLRTVYLKDGQSQTLTRTRYGYDAQGRLSSVATDLTPDDNSVADGQVYTTRYLYDGASRRVASLQQSDGSRLDFTYVLVGSDYRIQTVSDVRDGQTLTTRFDYDAGGGRTTVTDAANQATQLEYDNGQLRRVAGGGVEQRYNYDSHARVSDVTDGRGQSSHYDYDAAGNRVGARDAQQRQTSRRYNAQNQLISETVAGVGTSRLIYDASGLHLRFSVSAEGRVVEHRYDAQGREVSRLAYQGGIAGADDNTAAADLQAWAAKQDPARTERLDTAYDLRGLAAQTTRYATLDAQGNGVADGRQVITRYVYDAAGNLLQQLDGSGAARASYLYDGLNRVLRSVDGNNVATVTVYNDAQRQTRVSLSNGLTTVSSYDAAGQLIGALQQDAGGALGTASTQYNAQGLPVKLTDANGAVTYLVYDGLGRKVGQVDNEGGLTEWRYNGNGQVTATLRYANRAKLAALAGDPTTLQLADLRPAADPAGDRVDYRLYDSLGRLVQTIDAEGGVTRNQYDAADRLRASTRYANRLSADRLAALAQASGEPNPDDAANQPAADAANDRVGRAFYDADGLLVGQLDGEGYLTETRYDGAGHAVDTLRYAARANAGDTLAAIRPAAGAADQRTRALYDGEGRVVGQVDAEGYLSETVYDGQGRVAQTLRYAQRANPGDSLAQLRPAADRNDRKTLRQYDGAGQLIREETQPGGLVTTYQYDAQGHLTATTRSAGADSRSQLSRYDSQGRAIQTLGGEGAQALAALGDAATAAQIDAVWSRWGTRHYYNAGGQRTASLSPDGQGGAGRRTLYYYDGAGRLSHTLNSLGEVSEIRYNAFGEAIDSRRYATRLSAEQLARLNGGARNDLGTLVSGVQTAADSVETSQYNRLGQRVAAGDSLSAERERWDYNAFGDAIGHRLRRDANRSALQRTAYDRRGQAVGQTADAEGLALQTQARYDAFGRLTDSIDANGNPRHIDYDKLGRQLAVRDPQGGSQTTAYDAFGRALSHTDALGHVTATVYDDAAGTVTVTQPGGIQTVSQQNGYGETVKLIDPRGNATTYQYNRDGQLLSTTTPAGTTSSGYDSAGQLAISTDIRGVKTVYQYDAAGRALSRTVDPDGLKLITQTTYDAQGRALRQTEPGGRVTESRYDANGRLQAVIVDPDGLKLTTAYDYDAQGQKVRVTEAANTAQAKVTEYEYDGAGRRIRETDDPAGLKQTTRYSYDGNGNVTAKTDAAGNVTRYVYDGNDRLRYSIDPLGQMTEQRYDAAGNVTDTVRYATAIKLDGLDQALKASDLTARLKPSAQDQTTRTVYDAAGRPSFSVDAQGYVTERKYDAAGNVTDTVRYAKPVIGNLVGSPNAVNGDWLFPYSVATVPAAQAGFKTGGSAILQSDRDSYASGMIAVKAGETYSFEMDVIRGGTDDGRTPAPFGIGFQYSTDGVNYADSWVAATYSDASQTGAQHLQARLTIPDGIKGARIWLQINAKNTQTNRWYAQNVEVRKLGDNAANPLPAQLDEAAVRQRLLTSAQDQTTHNDYDNAGRLTAVSKNGIQTVRYELDAYGNRIKEWDGNNHLTTREFDTLGRVHKETHGEGDATVTDYDAFGNAVKITDPRGNAGYFYFDALGRRILQVDPEGGATRTDYDALGNARAVTRYANAVDPSTLQIGVLPTVAADAKRDAVSRIEHDALGRQTKITDAEGGVESMTYDAFGNKATYTNQLGAVFSYDYDAAGHVLKETGRDGATVLSVKRFEYDAFGNRTLQVEAEGQPEQRRTSYGYDSLNRLVSQRGDVVHTYTLTGADLKPLEADVAPTETRRYDAAGNLVEFIDANGNVTRTAYDSQNRKVRERNGDGYVTTWAYDGAGNVTEQRVYATAVGLPADGGAPQPADGNCRVTKFEYDNNNRLKRTIVPNQQVIALHRQPGDDNGAKSNYDILTSDLVTSRDYDANGNVIRETDANGNLAQVRDKANRSVHRYYDKAGRKLLEVDAAGYAMAWDYNSAGKPLRETRYAAAIGAPADSDTLDAVKARLKTDAQDRISEFDYDLLGRVKEERRLNVAYYQQDDFKGAAKDDAIQQTLQTGAVRTQYHYNALGGVDRKTDAKGGVTDMVYDKLGREIHREEAVFANQTGQMVRPTTDTAYNGLGQATQVRRAGVDGVFSETHYAAGGRVDWTKDAEGNATYYDYDAVGNISRTRRDRKEAAGGQDVTLYAYTAAKQQSVKQDAGSGLYFETRYNAWGQVTNKRTSLNRQGDWQEFSEYDGAGRLTRGNAGGVTKLYGYDANGNATMTVESGADSQDLLRSQDLQTVLNRLSDTQGANYQQYLNDYRLKLDEYDARNQHVATYQPRIANATDSQSVQVKAWEVAKPLTGNGDVVTVGAVPVRNGGTANPAGGGGIYFSQFGSAQYSAVFTKSGMAAGGYWQAFYYSQIKISGSFNGLIPGQRYSVRITFSADMYGMGGLASTGWQSLVRNIDMVVGAKGFECFIDTPGAVVYQGPGVTRDSKSFVSVELFESDSNRLVSSSQTGNVLAREFGTRGWGSSISVPPRLYFSDQPVSANRFLLLTRPSGSNAGWSVAVVPPMKVNGQNTAGWFAYDWSGMARGNYEYRYLALDAAGNVKNSGQGQMALNDSAPSVTPVRDANGQFRSAESTFMLEDGTISFYGVDPSAVQANIRFRRKGGEWGQVFKFDRPSPLLEGGRFILDPKQYALDSGVEYEYQVEFLSGGWQDFGIIGRVPKPKWVLLSPETLNEIVGSFKLGEPQSVTQPTPWSSQTQIVHLSNQSALAASGVVRYRLAGSQGDYITKALTKSGDGPGRFDWDTGENGAPAGNYEFEYQIFDAGGALINRLLGQMALGSNQDVKLDRNSGLILPLGVEFDPKQPSAARLDLSYRAKGGNGDWLQTQIPRNAAGTFLLNVDNWKEGDYEYRFILRDAAGAVINGADGSALETSGYIHRGSNSSQVNGQSLQWVVDKSLYNATVVRRQTYNAFGEVVSETDGVGNTTVSDYNAAGKLVAKREARLRLRDGDGNVLKNADGSDKLGDEAVTRYGYDAMGNLVSTVDANNHENKQRWLAGSQDGQGKVLRERHADGSGKEMGYDQLGNLRTQTVNGQRQQDYAYDKLGRLRRLDRAPGANGKRGYDEYDYDSAGQRIAHRTTSNGSDVLTDITRYDSLGRVLDTVSAATRHTSYSYVWDTQLKGAGGIVVGGWRMTTTNANQMTMQDATSLFGLKAEHRDLSGRVTQYQYNNAGQLATQSSSNGQNIVYTYYGNGNLQGIEDRAAHQYTLYGYDDDGRKTYEAYANGPNRNSLTFYQQSTLRYDERGRVIEIKDPRFLSRYQYDAVGNRQRVYSVYQDGKDGSRQVQDNWYDYDAMNRFTLSQGSRDASGNLARGSRGVSVEYDGFGQRAKVTNGSDGTVETYSYTADGYLVDTQINGKTAFHRDNDLLGRVTDSASYDWKNGDGGSKASQTHTDYDGDGKIARQVADGATTTYDLMNDGTVKTTTQVSKGTTTTTYYGYEWWDDAKQSTITAQPYNKDAPGWQPGISHLTYDVNGHLKEAIDEKGQRSLRYVNDAQGVVIRREEIDKQSVYKKQDYYYVDGKQVGAVGNDGPSRVDFAQALAQTSLGNKKDQYRFGVAVSSADFDQNYEPIGPNYPAQAPGSVTAREGDTLQVIAANLWGDRALWYLLADANGLQGTEALKAGQVLRVPNKVTNFHNNSGTYRVYSPGEAIGDVTPTLPEPPPPPPPPGGGGCGGFGMILVAVVAVVAVVFTAGALAPLLAPTLVSTAGVMASGMAVLTSASTLGALAAAGIAGAVGSIVSQGVAMAMGMQDKFSWGQVGMSALTTAATAGVGGAMKSPAVVEAFKGMGAAAPYAQAAVANVASQGIAMVSGQQKSFSWTSVAASVAAQGIRNSDWGRSLSASTENGLASMGASKDFAQAFSNMPLNYVQAAVGSFGSGLRGEQAWGSAFMQSGAQAVGDYGAYQEFADAKLGLFDGAWSEGGYARALAHMGVGALGSAWMGKDAWAGAIGAGASSLTTTWMADSLGLEGDAADRILPQLSRLPGAALAEMTGLDAMTAAGAGQNAAENNYLTHRQANGLIAALKRAQTPAEKNALLRLAQQVDRSQKLTGQETEAQLDSIAAGADILKREGWRLGHESGFTTVSNALLNLGESDWRQYKVGARQFQKNTGYAPLPYNDKALIDVHWDVDAVMAARALPKLAAGLAEGISAARSLGVRGLVAKLESVGSWEEAAKYGLCFAGGTLIHTRDGLKPIEKIVVGDWVLSQPEFKGTQAYRQVARTVDFADKEILRLVIRTNSSSQETLLCTRNHPFWVSGCGWLAAEQMQLGDVLELADGGEAVLLQVEAEEQRQHVYNFEVDGFHTYYVGKSGVWVHNTNCAEKVPSSRSTGLDRFVPVGVFSEAPGLSSRSSNAADALSRKLGALEKAQADAARLVETGDGRVIYYGREIPARTDGPTRGASLVTEYDNFSGRLRQYYESYDHQGSPIRVHPKMIDGLPVDSLHYPPTGKELGR
ncbi:RHS repeat/ LysM domain-containing protein [Chromobacterium vaccinii]|nr:RHS repeat/ LysM domain-containing protein [Chromobacterium vaccinii]